MKIRIIAIVIITILFIFQISLKRTFSVINRSNFPNPKPLFDKFSDISKHESCNLVYSEEDALYMGLIWGVNCENMHYVESPGRLNEWDLTNSYIFGRYKIPRFFKNGIKLKAGEQLQFYFLEPVKAEEIWIRVDEANPSDIIIKVSGTENKELEDLRRINNIDRINITYSGDIKSIQISYPGRQGKDFVMIKALRFNHLSNDHSWPVEFTFKLFHQAFPGEIVNWRNSLILSVIEKLQVYKLFINFKIVKPQWENYQWDFNREIYIDNKKYLKKILFDNGLYYFASLDQIDWGE